MPDPLKVLATVRKATDLLRQTSGRKGSVVHLEDAEEVMVVGDLHGNLRAFKWAMAEAALERNPGRHLVLQELIHEVVKEDEERPDLSHRAVDLFCALKCQYPERVHVILGNHELAEMTGRIIGKNDRTLNQRFRDGIRMSYGERADDIYKAYVDVITAMPLAARTPNRVFICHSIPYDDMLDDLDLSVLDAESWPAESTKRGGAVYAITWGRDTSAEAAEHFARMVDADLFVTGHQHCEEGFRRANDRQLIIDGTEPYPAYCCFPAKSPITIDSLVDSVKVLALED